LRVIEARLRINFEVADAVGLLVAGLAPRSQNGARTRQIAAKGCVRVESRMRSDRQNRDGNLLN
jgi:hypothetical protein